MTIEDSRYLTDDDKRNLSEKLNFKKKNPQYRIFLASKSGRNNRGVGSIRSVVLCNHGKGAKKWRQFMKFFGDNDVMRANEAILIYNNFN